MKPKVAIVAHRGASGRFPENTAAAFQEAIKLGVDMIEFDIHLTKDEELVVIHDDSVDRTSNGSGRVADLTLREIKALDAGSWFDECFANEKMLTLSQTLDLMPETIRLNIHVKTYPHNREVLIPKVLAEIEKRGILHRSFIASDAESVKLAKSINPSLDICNLSGQEGGNYVEFSRRLGSTIIQPGHSITTKELVEDAHANNMEVNVFYADEEDEMMRLIECGVDGILTNYPERLKSLMEKMR